jgi:hypothetical protein
MKTTDKSSEKSRNFDQLISKLSENAILNLQAMSCVKGGNSDGEGNGGSPVIIMPKPPQ